MAATTGTLTEISPLQGATIGYYVTAATADSGDTLDISGTFSDVLIALGYLETVGAITVTNSSGTLTIDNGGGRTNSAYYIFVVGVRKQV